jgi:hypothetical protein
LNEIHWCAIWLGWPCITKKNETAKTTPIAPTFKKLYLPQKNGFRLACGNKFVFQIFGLGFCMGEVEVASQSPENTLWVRNFLFYCESRQRAFRNHLEHLHRTSTKNYRRIEVSPMALRALHFFW